jgi:sec-independent protein translocase protein TatA
MFNIGPMELILILTLALLLFGPKKLPEIGKTVGRALSEFRKASVDIRREISQGMNEQAPAVGSPGANGGAAGSDGASTAPDASSPGATAPHPPSQQSAPPSDAAPGA